MLTWVSIGMGAGLGTSPQMYLMAPTPAIRIAKEAIMVKVISRS